MDRKTLNLLIEDSRFTRHWYRQVARGEAVAFDWIDSLTAGLLRLAQGCSAKGVVGTVTVGCNLAAALCHQTGNQVPLEYLIAQSSRLGRRSVSREFVDSAGETNGS